MLSNCPNFRVVNKKVSESALKALDRHLWYLTEELVVLAIFSSKVSLEEKEKMANKLMELEPEEKIINPGKFSYIKKS